jgi:hypothetical protein
VVSGMLFAGVQLPAVRSMMAFAVVAPPPTPPPPPPPLVPAAQQTPPEAPKPVLVSRHAAPVETLAEILPEAPVMDIGTACVWRRGWCAWRHSGGHRRRRLRG